MTCALQPLPSEVEELLRNEEMAFQGQNISLLAQYAIIPAVG